jgi:cytochrome c-type biogenesis protein CcmH
MSRLSMRLAALTVAVVAGLAGPLAAQQTVHVNEPELYQVAQQLRCVVCQNLSVADSPSEMAQQMRGVIRERLAAGERPDQVVQYFVDKYGEWILLEPRRQGFTMLVWVLPPLAALLGVAVVGVLLVRWTRRRAVAAPPVTGVDAAMQERIRRELEAQR